MGVWGMTSTIKGKGRGAHFVLSLENLRILNNITPEIFFFLRQPAMRVLPSRIYWRRVFHVCVSSYHTVLNPSSQMLPKQHVIGTPP